MTICACAAQRPEQLERRARGRAGASFRSVAANPSRWPVDFAAYLRFEREAAERHELIDGEIVAMAGATRRHNMLCGRLHDAIRPPLGEGPCILERSDQRRGVKLEDYLQIGSLDEYLIVSHERRELELWTRAADGWSRQLATGGTVRLKCGAVIDVERLYDGLPS